MIKILHVIDCMQNLGGAQEILVELVKRLPSESFSQQIIRLHGQNSYAKRLPKSDYPSMSLAPGKYHLFTMVCRLYRHLKQHRYDIVHLHLQVSSVVGTLLARLCGAPNVIVTIYASKGQSPWWVFQAFALLSPFVDVFVGLTEHQLSGLVEHSYAQRFLKPSSIRMIPVGIDPPQLDRASSTSTIRQELGISEDVPLVLNVARFRYRKGQAYLLRAMAEVVKAVPKTRCLIVGHGPEQKPLQQLTRELHLEHSVDFLIARNDIDNLLSGCDLLVNSSLFEAMGVIDYQAMAHAKAIVSFNAGSVSEVVVDGETGALVPVRDIHALATAIVSLLKNPNLRSRYGKAGRQRFEASFLLDDKIKDYEELYKALNHDATHAGVRHHSC